MLAVNILCLLWCLRKELLAPLARRWSLANPTFVFNSLWAITRLLPTLTTVPWTLVSMPWRSKVDIPRVSSSIQTLPDSLTMDQMDRESKASSHIRWAPCDHTLMVSRAYNRGFRAGKQAKAETGFRRENIILGSIATVGEGMCAAESIEQAPEDVWVCK